MKIFLTGGSGKIGKVIKHTLEDKGIEVISPNSQELNLSGTFDLPPYPSVDGFIHCAGVNKLSSYKNLSYQDMIHPYNVNTLSFIKICKQLKIKKKSNIIAIGSLYATQTKENRTPYTMSKHALLGAVKTLALEMASKKIKVNMISPGFVDTPLTRKNNSKERINELNSSIPLGLTSPQEIAEVCKFFITQNNSITGQNIIVDGGYSLVGI